jgi:putative zinc finger/helix-turn-helix YgiT family protein
MNSPITGKPMELRVESKTLPFRKEEFTVVYRSYYCEDSGEEFVTPEMGDANLNQVYNAYREKHNIPFPDEIKKIRTNYGLSATKMAEVLGFGVNMYRAYESGEIPNESNARLIQSIADPKAFKKLLSFSSVLSEKDKRRTYELIDSLIDEEDQSIVSREEYIMEGRTANQYTGYKTPDLEKALHVILFFAKTLKPWQTGLNKLLFYADFGHYKMTGRSITGLSYRAITYGVVPKSYGKLFAEAEEQHVVKVHYQYFDSSANIGQQYLPDGIEFNSDLFDLSEIETLQKVSERFKGLSTAEIVRANHEEKAWLNNVDGRDLVSYKESFYLQHI